MQNRADLETRLKSSRFSNDKNRFQNFHDILAPRRKIFGISCIVVAVDVVDVVVFVVDIVIVVIAGVVVVVVVIFVFVAAVAVVAVLSLSTSS